MANHDPFEMAEPGMDKLAEVIDQGKPKAKRKAKEGDPKAKWEQTNIRMDPEVKRRLKAQARALEVPLEELVHVALLPFLDDLEADEIELETRTVATRKTLL